MPGPLSPTGRLLEYYRLGREANPSFDNRWSYLRAVEPLGTLLKNAGNLKEAESIYADMAERSWEVARGKASSVQRFFSDELLPSVRRDRILERSAKPLRSVTPGRRSVLNSTGCSRNIIRNARTGGPGSRGRSDRRSITPGNTNWRSGPPSKRGTPRRLKFLKI